MPVPRKDCIRESRLGAVPKTDQKQFNILLTITQDMLEKVDRQECKYAVSKTDLCDI